MTDREICAGIEANVPIAGRNNLIPLIPGFVAFPLAASLVKAGAGYGQIAMFVTTLIMVGVATFPLESKYFGRSVALKRNVLSLIIAVITSFLIGGIMA